MIKSVVELENRKIEIDLTGPQGNVFYLLGVASKLAKQLGRNAEIIIKEMHASNYDNAVAVFDREFGDFINLYR